MRRAVKDLQQIELFRVEETEESVLVHGDGWTVTMPPEGPVAAADDTPATGVTRQIIAATLFLRDHWASDDSGDVDAEESTSPIAIEDEASTYSTDEAFEQRLDEAVKVLVAASTDELFQRTSITVGS